MAEKRLTEFEQVAQKGVNNILTDVWYWLRYNKKWWLLPVIAILALFAAVIMLSTTGAAPLIYTLF
jgi:drug/metabolite transporter superfamily protein YnfA